eukprot:CAMPEP_0203869134 /NCGR_PEP_ID=MMETSP0359-20131031/17531_1 /ASSEMBLY_ACC=CAM_ASM_000338 /TAXON_ID=268821 /ORGANISM="Scrippsiella Hangoei, Strain SHTV-5" /LENGTH=37 /DNA_ID= /DNA_START= /DNA_END= /DNA_ORIENTATION=
MCRRGGPASLVLRHHFLKPGEASEEIGPDRLHVVLMS